MKCFTSLCGAVVAASAVSNAAGAVSWLSSHRVAEATTSLGFPGSGQSTTVAFSDLGWWDGLAINEIFLGGPSLNQYASASQLSFVGDDFLSMSGHMEAHERVVGGGAGLAVAYTQATAKFRLTEVALWRSDRNLAFVQPFIFTTFIFQISIRDLHTSQFVLNTGLGDGLHGTLPPGDYEVQYTMSLVYSGASTSGGAYNYAARFTIPSAPTGAMVLASGACLGRRRRRDHRF